MQYFIKINKNKWEKFFKMREIIWGFMVNHFHFLVESKQLRVKKEFELSLIYSKLL
jgi:hypothetical protein